LSGVRVYLRNFALIALDEVDVASTAFCVLSPGEELDPAYLFLWVSSDQFIHRLLPLQRGNSPPAVLDADVRDQLIPLPPTIEDQRRIVLRLTALFAEIDDGEAALADASAGVETYRKALLKAAVTGELTADWRRENPPTETGEDLLHRILADRRARWEADPKNRKKTYVTPTGPDVSSLATLPEGWCWAGLDQLAWSAQYGTSVKCAPDGAGEPVLRIPNLRAGTIDLADLKYANSPLDVGDADYVAPGDLLIVRTNGSEELIGRTGVALDPLETPTFFASYLIRFRLTGDRSTWNWIRAFTESAVFRACVRASIGSSAGQYNLSMSNLDTFPIAIPPENEIIEVLRRLGEVEVRVGLDIDVATLRQSILSAAFRGELIS
jgi:type I restriction enzyme S subunit